MSLSIARYDGAAAADRRWRMSDGIARIEVLPELGGKISSLTHLPSGLELLFRSSRPLRPRSTGDSFADHDASGWDECFPSIAAEEIEIGGRVARLPDHGELWTLPFAARRDGDALALEARGACLPYAYRKRIALDHGRVDVAVEIENLGDEAWSANWVLHALCRWEDDLELAAPPGCPAPSLPPPGGAGKAWFYRPLEGRCGIGYPALGMEFRVEWDIAILPAAALWATNGGYRGERNLAWEPAMAPCDKLSDAIASGSAPLWRPREIKSFGYSIAWEPRALGAELT
jgi:hypothetical protein